MIVITGEFELHPEDVWPASSAMVKMMEASGVEPGCRAYRFYADLLNPRRFRIYEEWTDEASLKAHFETEHMAEFQRKLKEFRVMSRKVKRFDVGETEAM